MEPARVFDVPGVRDRDFGPTGAEHAIGHRPAGTGRRAPAGGHRPAGTGRRAPSRPPRTAEADAPRRAFREAFTRARDAGPHRVPHAGGTTGPDRVRQALDDLHAERIGHGTSAVRDPELLRRPVAEGIALEVCPTSSPRTGAVRDPADHPLPRLPDAGVPVTLATDDPGVFHTDPDREHLLRHERFGPGEAEPAEIDAPRRRPPAGWDA